MNHAERELAKTQRVDSSAVSCQAVQLGVKQFEPCLPIAEADRDPLDHGDLGSRHLEIGGLR